MGATTFTSFEYPDIKALDIMIKKWESLNLSERMQRKTWQGKEYKLLPLLKKYKKSIVNGRVPVHYEYSKNHFLTGRQFCKSSGGSLQGLKRWVRHTLSKGYYDYDIVNCHPTVFLQYCQKHNWNTTIFENYNKNRDKFLQELMDTNNLERDDAKQVVLSLLNGGLKDYNNLSFKPDWLTEYKQAVYEIHRKILELPENKELKAHIQKEKERNPGGRVMNHLLCQIENDILMKTIEFLHVQDPILIFDGFQARELYTETQLRELEKEILEKTGYSVSWVIKPMDYGIDLSDFDTEEITENPTDEKTPLELLDQLMTTHSDYIKNINDTIYIFDKTTGMWVKNGLGIFMNMCADTFGRNSKYGGFPEDIQKIFKMCKTLPDSTDWFIQARNNRLGKLLYSNGVLDIENCKFLQFNANLFFTKRIPRPFVPKKDQEHFDKVLNTLFYAPHKPEIAREFLKAVSLAMTGKNPDESSYDNLGTGSNGKTLLQNALLEAFPGYVEPFPIVAFRVSPTANPNAHNDLKVKMADIRIGLSSEGAAGMITDSEEFKRMCSQEQFYARECGEKAVKIKPEMTLFTFSQNPLVFDKIDKAVMRRRFGFPWNITFEKAKNGELDFLNETKTYEALDHIILYGYSLWKKEKFLVIEELSSFKEELDSEQDIFSEIFEESFEIAVGDKTDQNNWIKSRDVYKYFKRMNTSEYTIKKKFLNIGIDCKRARGPDGNVHYFQGIKKKD